jgi:hypothetical protein
MNKEVTIEQTAAREKAEAVINSCANCEHFESTKPYLELFLKQFQDQEAYNELVLLIQKRKQELNCFEI